MKLSRISFLFLLLFLLIMSFAVAQTSRSVIAAANKSWTKFFTEFRAAVIKLDRAALKTMISDEFDWTNGELGIPPDRVLSNLDGEKMWKYLQKSLVLNHFKATTYGSRPARYNSKGENCFFVFEADGRWRWQSFMGGD